MAVTTVVIREVWCDADGCVASVNVDDDGQGGLTLKQTRAVARGEGWAYRSGQDFCPLHKQAAR